MFKSRTLSCVSIYLAKRLKFVAFYQKFAMLKRQYHKETHTILLYICNKHLVTKSPHQNCGISFKLWSILLSCTRTLKSKRRVKCSELQYRKNGRKSPFEKRKLLCNELTNKMHLTVDQLFCGSNQHKQIWYSAILLA